MTEVRHILLYLTGEYVDQNCPVILADNKGQPKADEGVGIHPDSIASVRDLDLSHDIDLMLVL